MCYLDEGVVVSADALGYVIDTAPNGLEVLDKGQLRDIGVVGGPELNRSETSGNEVGALDFLVLDHCQNRRTRYPLYGAKPPLVVPFDGENIVDDVVDQEAVLVLQWVACRYGMRRRRARGHVGFGVFRGLPQRLWRDQHVASRVDLEIRAF